MEIIKHTSLTGFTVEDLKKLFSDSKLKSAKIYNSCMYEDYTIEKLKKSEIKEFEPIDGIYVEYGLVATYNFCRETEPFTVEKLLESLPNDNPDLVLERDIEDGYRYADYEVILITNEYVVFC